MERVAVVSRNIASIGYDSTSAVLEVAFLDGGVYQYFNVPSGVHLELMSAQSHGKYFNTQIKGRYNYVRVS